MLSILRALVAATILVPLSAIAQTPSCDRPQIFFVNGVWNYTPLDAKKSAAELESAIQEQGVDRTQYGLATTAGNATAIRPFWNPGDPGEDTILKDGVVQGGVGEQVKAGIRDILEVFLNQSTAGRALADALGDANLVWVKRLAAYLGLNKPGVAFQGYIDELKAQLASEIAKKRPIVVVAHSQGNILVNRAVTALLADNPDARGIVSVVGVGVADDGTAGDGYRYVTASNDLVIGALPGARTANFAVTTPGIDTSGHAFVETYLSKGGITLSDPVRGVYSGDGGATQGFSLRATVAQLTKKGLARVGCVETTTELVNRAPVQSTIGSPFTFSVKTTPAKTVAEKPLLGRVRIIGSGGELCNANVSPNGSASCAVTFSGSPRSESIKVVFEGRGGYIDSQTTAAVDIKSAVRLISATPTAINLNSGGTQQLAAVIKDAFGNLISPQPPVMWSSANPSIATVSSAGLVTGVANGTTTVRVSELLSLAYVDVSITVTDLYVGKVSISGPASIPECGGTMSVVGSASLSLVDPPNMTLTVNEVISLGCYFQTTPSVIFVPLTRSGNSLSGVVKDLFNCPARCISGESSYFVTLQINNLNPALAITGSLQHTNINQTPFTANATGPISLGIN